MIRVVLVYTLLFILLAYVLNQARKPSRFLGRLFLLTMNKSHSQLTDWGLGHISVEKHFNILDVGCGGGRTIEKLLGKATDGQVYGVDYAAGSVSASRSKNANMIKAGRVDIQRASVSQLPFPNDNFDLVTAIETQYYWPDLVNDMKEILRVLKPGGKLLLIAETYKGGKYDLLKWPVMKLLRSSHLSVADQRELFSSAGYQDIELFEERSKGWICGVGQKAL